MNRRAFWVVCSILAACGWVALPVLHTAIRKGATAELPNVLTLVLSVAYVGAGLVYLLTRSAELQHVTHLQRAIRYLSSQLLLVVGAVGILIVLTPDLRLPSGPLVFLGYYQFFAFGALAVLLLFSKPGKVHGHGKE